MNNKKEYSFVNYKIPCWAIAALAYGDYSGLEKEDIKLIEEFEGMELPSEGDWDFSKEERNFTLHPAFGLACKTIPARYYY